MVPKICQFNMGGIGTVTNIGGHKRLTLYNAADQTIISKASNAASVAVTDSPAYHSVRGRLTL
ncbi:hypothetical protein J6590_102563, partial [Homalodisca vitripennis]